MLLYLQTTDFIIILLTVFLSLAPIEAERARMCAFYKDRGLSIPKPGVLILLQLYNSKCIGFSVFRFKMMVSDTTCLMHLLYFGLIHVSLFLL